MSEAVIVAILGFAGTLLGSLCGILAAQKLTVHRVAQLEKTADRHDVDLKDVSDRTTRLEGRMNEAEHDIRDLKAHHPPKSGN